MLLPSTPAALPLRGCGRYLVVLRALKGMGMTTARSSAKVVTSFLTAAQSSAAGHRRQGEVQVQLIYKPYEDDEEEDEAEPEPYELLVEEQNITDIKSAAGPRPRPSITQ